MKNLIVFLLLLSNSIFAQIEGGFAIIKDKDGYANVRKERDIHSKVLKKLNNNTLIYVYEYNKKEEGNWLKADDEGYIYYNRVKCINRLPQIAKVFQKDNIVYFQSKGISITLTGQKFDEKKHIFTRDVQGGFISKIDGKDFQGTDGNMPIKEYKNIEVVVNRKPVAIPKIAYNDLYNPNLDMANSNNYSYNTVYYDKETDTIYIVTSNSDGAGGYEVCWQIEKGIYKGRKIARGF